jgi:hypothetical protein
MKLSRSLYCLGSCLLAAGLARAVEPPAPPAPPDYAPAATAAAPPPTADSPDCSALPAGDCQPLCPPTPPFQPCVLGFPELAKEPRCLVPPLLGGGFPGWFYNGAVRLPTQTANIPLGGARVSLLAPLLSEGNFRIGENESPQPQDRFFFNYNFFRDAGGVLNRSRGDFAPIAATLPIRVPREDVHLGTVGFEKTLGTDRASIGLRVPIFGITNDGGFTGDPVADANIGDLSVIFKYALLCDRASGSTLSGGLVVTIPVGDQSHLFNGQTLNATLLQPFVGYLWNTPSFYVQGFSSYVFSVDGRLPDLFTSDIGVGWWLYRAPVGPARSNAFADRNLPAQLNAFDYPPPRSNAFSDSPAGVPFLSGFVPTIEAHLNKPVEGRSTDLIRTLDSVVVTGGAHFLLLNSCNLGIGFGTPVTGPRAFDWGVFAQLNINY